MSVYDFYRRKMKITSSSTGKNYLTLGEQLKQDSDNLMELTWDNDIQSKVCYIYDYFHDDFFVDEHGITRTLKDGMTYDHTNKTRVDAKFIVKTYQSMDKDQVEYYLQFKPSQKFSFTEGDELYYYETDYHQRYSAEFPIGLFCDIPDDRGVYHKWLICRSEPANQFPKFLILPCSYELMWIEKNGKDRIKRRMWSVLRQQQSYTSGVYIDRYIGHTDNQNKVWLPMNSITEKLWYVLDDDKNMRLIVSALTSIPSTWKVTKVENAVPFGLQKLTIYSNFFNEHTDYVNFETGEMYADYYDSEITPTNPEPPQSSSSVICATIETSTNYIKIGGGYKTLTLKIFDSSNEDVTSTYQDAYIQWTCSIDGVDCTDIVSWRVETTWNQRRLKFPLNRSLLGKILLINCSISMDTEIFKSKDLALEITD